MSPKLNWVDNGGAIVSPEPCTAMTMVAILRRANTAGEASTITAKNETTIVIDGQWGVITLKGMQEAAR